MLVVWKCVAFDWEGQHKKQSACILAHIECVFSGPWINLIAFLITWKASSLVVVVLLLLIQYID